MNKNVETPKETQSPKFGISDVSDSDFFDFMEELVSNKDSVKFFGGDDFNVANYWFSVGVIAMNNKKISQMKPNENDFPKK